MAEQKQEITYVPVKAEDIMAERKALYDGFMRAIPIAVGTVAAILILLYLIWG